MYIYLHQFCIFPEKLHQDMPLKAENVHASSHKRCLDICFWDTLRTDNELIIQCINKTKYLNKYQT